MSVTTPVRAERDDKSRQIDRLVSSNLLQGSESLCKLLRYLAEQAAERPGSPVSEKQIATEVFGRPGSFDPRLDSTVRVQTGRLRSKLSEYYAGPGADDPICVELPKGSYALAFHNKPAPAAPDTDGLYEPAPRNLNIDKTEPEFLAAGKSRALIFCLVALSAALACALALIAWLVVMRPIQTARPAPTSEVAAFRTLWKGFIDQTEAPMVVFSNAEFIGRPETGMRYFDPASDLNKDILDHYTGVGEVLAVHELDQVFGLLNHGLKAKRGRLLSLDDAKNNNIIFVGSPSENLTLREIPASRDFVFRRIDSPARKGDLGIINVHPKNDEQRLYLASQNRPITEDHAIVALVPGLNQARLVMLLAGITTLGTQAAVEYVCRGPMIEELLQKLTGSKTGPVVPFEAVLKVKVMHGVPVSSQIVALHARQAPAVN